MSSDSQLTPLQRWQTNGPQAQEKVLKKTSHKGNANQNHFKIAPHSYQNGHHQKIRDKYWWECGERNPWFLSDQESNCEPPALAGRFLNHSTTSVVGNANLHSHHEKKYFEIPQKKRNRTAIWSSNSTSKHASRSKWNHCLKEISALCSVQYYSQLQSHKNNPNVHQPMNKENIVYLITFLSTCDILLPQYLNKHCLNIYHDDFITVLDHRQI